MNRFALLLGLSAVFFSACKQKAPEPTPPPVTDIVPDAPKTEEDPNAVNPAEAEGAAEADEEPAEGE